MRPRYDFHTHTFLSDGSLLPMELLRRVYVAGHKAVAITDHASFSNAHSIIESAARDCEVATDEWGIEAIPGVEITHVPPRRMAELVAKCRRWGAELIVVHGESPVEPVASGTNAAAASNPEVDILAHPGLLEPADAEAAAENGIYLEITCRNGHALCNQYVFEVGGRAGAKFLVNTDMHNIEDISTYESARKVARKAGMGEKDVARALETNPLKLLKKVRKD